MSTLKDIIDELLKQKINDDDNTNINNNNNKDKKLNNQEIFNKLSTYLPEISVNNLEQFTNDTYEQLSKLNHKITYDKTADDLQPFSLFQYNLNNQFFDTINENSLKYNSIIRKRSRTTKSKKTINIGAQQK
ncbi:hypothetical protein DICPUDRAFT_84337 [Dictyostelium purpureum]|uniref:Uncharacterized protein n=1 Tax=Dictyostelium purpureum TaxID=5786 RepID=F1A2C4_DICPU|nr:uncharacterized protein DICPUDRAFT_84337 [Dictyostelium purpureum]EGC29649.1 hypothetical protein DICPUDRAFT_84337 [Dictyostelium purpureum]|eukprot:XP_003293818.1 hypothetical protein DICPUDRAFT_84337 [Dictyostelium purpureum]